MNAFHTPIVTESRIPVGWIITGAVCLGVDTALLLWAVTL